MGFRILAAALLLPASAAAQVITFQPPFSFSPTGAGGRAAGMGNAFIALSDDGTAESWNPAGLAQLRRPELSLVEGVLRRSAAYEGFYSLDTQTSFTPMRHSSPSASLDFASVAVPFRVGERNVTLQAGWRRFYPLTFRSNAILYRESTGDPGVSAEIGEFLDTHGDVDTYSVAAAVRVAPRVSVGASLDLWRGDRYFELVVNQTGGRSGGHDSFTYTLHDRLKGVGVDAGVLFTYPSWSLGAVYHHAPRGPYELQTTIRSTRLPPLGVGLGPEWGMRMKFADAWGIGAAWRPSANWTVSADLNRDMWSDAGITGVPGTTGRVNIFDQQPVEITSTRDTLALNVGVERLLHREGYVIPLRAGAGYQPQGGMDLVTRDPVDYILLAAGTGFNTNAVKLDLAMQYQWTAYRGGWYLSVDSLTQPAPRPDGYGRVRTSEWRVKLSVIYRVTDTARLRDVLRTVFVGS